MSLTTEPSNVQSSFQTQYLKYRRPHNPTNKNSYTTCILMGIIAILIIMIVGICIYAHRLRAEINRPCTCTCNIIDSQSDELKEGIQTDHNGRDSTGNIHEGIKKFQCENEQKTVDNPRGENTDLKQLEIELSLQEIEGIPKHSITDFLGEIARDIADDILQNYEDRTKLSEDLNKYRIDQSDRRVQQLHRNILTELERVTEKGFSFDYTTEIKIQLRNTDSYSKIIFGKMRITSIPKGDDVDLHVALSVKTKSY